MIKNIYEVYAPVHYKEINQQKATETETHYISLILPNKPKVQAVAQLQRPHSEMAFPTQALQVSSSDGFKLAKSKVGVILALQRSLLQAW